MYKLRRKLLSISVFITIFSVVIHIVNKLISASATLNNLLKTKNGNYYNWRFGNIYYTKQGSGSPLLLIHDLTPCSNAEEWKSVVGALSQNYTVYTLDLLGCGRSDKPQMTYANFLYVQLLTDFAKNIIGEKTDVIASGLASSFVVMTCANDPDTFGKAMLINPDSLTTLNQIPSKQTKIVKYLVELPLIGTFIYNMLTSKTNIELLFTEKYLYNPFRTDQPLLDTYFEAAHTQKGNGKYLLSSILGKYIYFNISHGLKSINNSIFVVGGEGEESIQDTFAMYTALNASVECELVPNTKHLPQLEAPEQLLGLINNFF